MTTATDATARRNAAIASFEDAPALKPSRTIEAELEWRKAERKQMVGVIERLTSEKNDLKIERAQLEDKIRLLAKRLNDVEKVFRQEYMP